VLSRVSASFVVRGGPWVAGKLRDSDSLSIREILLVTAVSALREVLVLARVFRFGGSLSARDRVSVCDALRVSVTVIDRVWVSVGVSDIYRVRSVICVRVSNIAYEEALHLQRTVCVLNSRCASVPL
jgi:hypothetical protein